MMRPVLRKPLRIKGTELYQPIFIGNVIYDDDETVQRLYDTKYVRDNCMSWEKGIGRIYIKKDSDVTAYNTSASVEWLPERTNAPDELFVDIQSLTLEWQLYIIKNLVAPSMKLLSGERKREAIKLINLAKDYNRKMVELLNEVKRY